MHRPYLVPFMLFVLLLGCGGDDGTSPPPPASDTTAPETIGTLEVISSTGSTVTLSWRTPGDDGVAGSARQYDLRYSATALTDSNWAAAMTPDSTPRPQTAGAWVTHTLSDLPLGTWHLAIKTADEVPNWSGISNVVQATVADVVSPSAITDLAAGTSTPNSVTLFWTSPDDEGPTQRAAQYDLRRSDAVITVQNWSTAIPITGLPIPAEAGAIDSYVVTGLAEGTTYYFALKAIDASGNVSTLSNVISVGTTSSTLFRVTWNVTGKPSVEPSWSPDGNEIVFTVGTMSESEIYRMPIPDGTPVRLTNNGATDRLPAWSPDGTKIAFATDRGGQPELWVMTADGSDPQFVADLEAATRFISRSAWSPDGTRLVYMTGDGGTSVSPTSLWIIPATGGTRELLVAGAEWMNSDPAWSPDGTKIAYMSSIGWRFRIWVKPLNTEQPYQLTFADPQQTTPCWSPDGTTIAYASNQGGDLDIWTVPATGGPPTQLISNPDVDVYPAWSPDGSRMAFCSNRSGQMEVWIKVLE